METWRAINDFADYQVSDAGQIRGPKGFVLHPAKQTNGYLFVTLARGDGTRKQKTVHRIVAETFIGPPPHEKAQVAHGNGNPLDNRLANLRWATAAENAADRARHGRTVCGESSSFSKLTVDEVLQIRTAPSSYGYRNTLMRQFGISRAQITRIRNGRNWAHLHVTNSTSP